MVNADLMHPSVFLGAGWVLDKPVQSKAKQNKAKTGSDSPEQRKTGVDRMKMVETEGNGGKWGVIGRGFTIEHRWEILPGSKGHYPRTPNGQV